MKKLLAIIGITTLIVIAIVLVTRHNQNHSQPGKSYDVKCIQSSEPPSATDTLMCTINARPKTKQSDQESPAWDVLTTWPESITAWLLLLTLIAISWQAWETREAAQATASQAKISRQALIAQFRPKVIIRKMTLDPSAVLYFDRRADSRWILGMQLHNVGGTTAHVLKCEGYFQTHEGESGSSRDDIAVLWVDTPFDIPAGGKHPLDLQLPAQEFRGILAIQEAIVKDDPRNAYVHDFLAYHGTVTYRDDNGLDRETGFSRNLYMKDVRFLASSDPTAEYQD